MIERRPFWEREYRPLREAIKLEKLRRRLAKGAKTATNAAKALHAFGTAGEKVKKKVLFNRP